MDIVVFGLFRHEVVSGFEGSVLIVGAGIIEEEDALNWDRPNRVFVLEVRVNKSLSEVFN